MLGAPACQMELERRDPMCSNIVVVGDVAGSGRSQQGWFDIKTAVITFDHPSHTNVEHSINISLMNEAEGPGARVAVELTADSARELIRLLRDALSQGEAEHLTTGPAGQSG
jgi:hypothetical protein